VPHPALHISRRTASAIHFVIEEAIRVPYSFTPDPVEENAPMADLAGNGRAANGGARTTAGPVPVTQAERANIRPPTTIMKERREREASKRLQMEADARAADEQRQAEEERRKSAERRAYAAGVAGAPTTMDPAPQRTAGQSAPLRQAEEQYATYPAGVPRQAERVVPTSGGMANPPISSQAQETGRPRASSLSQQQSRPAPGASASDPRRPPPTQQSRRPPAPASSQPAPSTTALPPPPAQPGQSASQARQSSISNFPHAFERWETLSSHWEGLTSYWIRRLEQNTEEVRREPLAQQMSRQITDLSAAGANLFHAVVELQRLRASSERKFQRWFYEHRQEQEKAQEREAQLEHTLRVERESRANALVDMERMSTEKKNAERMVVEMKRELQISKEEARRAWEELGRRVQEERDRTFSLREGQPTWVGGVQVVPSQTVGRQGSVSQRQHAGDEAYGIGSGEGMEQQYSHEEDQSPTDTDPFTEGRHMGAMRHEEDVTPPPPNSYVPSGFVDIAAAQASSPQAVRPLAVSRPADRPQVPTSSSNQARATTAHQSSDPSTSQPEAFYQQSEAYLHNDPATSIPEDEQSYVGTSHAESEGDEEYAIDERGNFILDPAGHRIPYRSLRHHDSDEYDVTDDRRRELEHLQHYGTSAQGPSSYTTTSNAGPAHQGGHPTAGRPDYSGAGYGDEWAGMRHHHPTRLSDVLEEDERSVAMSQGSRRFY
jgi:hypothetical protein